MNEEEQSKVDDIQFKNAVRLLVNGFSNDRIDRSLFEAVDLLKEVIEDYQAQIDKYIEEVDKIH